MKKELLLTIYSCNATFQNFNILLALTIHRDLKESSVKLIT